MHKCTCIYMHARTHTHAHTRTHMHKHAHTNLQEQEVNTFLQSLCYIHQHVEKDTEWFVDVCPPRGRQLFSCLEEMQSHAKKHGT